MSHNLDVIATNHTNFDGVAVGRSDVDLLALYWALAKYDHDYHGESLVDAVETPNAR